MSTRIVDVTEDGDFRAAVPEGVKGVYVGEEDELTLHFQDESVVLRGPCYWIANRLTREGQREICILRPEEELPSVSLEELIQGYGGRPTPGTGGREWDVDLGGI